jgi:hypothetical protein
MIVACDSIVRIGLGTVLLAVLLGRSVTLTYSQDGIEALAVNEAASGRSKRCERCRQKQRTSASACARRKSSTAERAMSVERNSPPRFPGTCAMLSTVSAAT